jgi:transposase
VHARKAKLMLGMINKTDKLDARGLNRLQQTGTLPTVWIPPGELRDRRDLPRTRMVLVRQRTQLKNRVHATLAKYGRACPEVSDLFGARGRERLRPELEALPPETAYATRQLLEQIEALGRQVRAFEQRIRQVLKPTPEIALLQTLPGVGATLAVVIALEVGEVARFPTAEKLAGYAGTTPRVRGSGGKVRHGRLRPDVNRYLKWAFIEAANVICRHRGRAPHRHVSRLYARLAQTQRKGHQKAIGAVARHLAEATYWMLTRRESYHEPARPARSGSAPAAPAREAAEFRGDRPPHGAAPPEVPPESPGDAMAPTRPEREGAQDRNPHRRLSAGGERIERRARPEPSRGVVVLGDRPRARSPLAVSTDQE